MPRMSRVLVLLLVTMLAGGCRAGRGDLNGSPFAPTGLVSLPGAFEPGETIQTWADALRPLEGVYVRDDGGFRYVLVAMGERPTGGYRVDLNDAMEAEDYVLLEVVYRAPGPGDMVTQALTYPYLLLRVKTEKDIRVNRLNERGEPSGLPLHEDGSAVEAGPIVIESPVPFEGIGTTVRLRGRVKTDLPVYACLEDGHYQLLEATRLDLSAAGDGWWRFDQEFTLRGASSPSGMLEIWFGDGPGRATALVPLCLMEWSYANK
ncbi:MAG: protease complex subunit PrcB family protein [bacterium]|nr:protease complex subunit PrcB family protein [bacterium]